LGTRIVRVMICDLCGGENGVRRWRLALAGDGKKVSPDLCESCEKPFVEIMEKLPNGKRGQTQGRPVLTEAQVRAKRRNKK
jgi:hypothetical protein